MEVIIARGLPGSGKSFWIENYIREKHSHIPEGEFIVCSADHFHMKEGEYQYKPENQARAHLACFEKYLYTIMERDSREKIHTLFVDNTNTQAWEIAPYYQLAALHGIPVRIVRLHVLFEIAVKRNVHGVPASTIWRMQQNLIFERLPAYWKEEILVGGNTENRQTL